VIETARYSPLSSLIRGSVMNSSSNFNWEQAKYIADLLVFEQSGDHLKDTEIQVLQGSWEGLTYTDMAERYYLSVNYLRGDLGNRLWKRLSDALEDRVCKKNFKGALERASINQENFKGVLESAFQDRQLSSPEIDPPQSAFSAVSDLPFPEGAVSLESPFYLERLGVDTLCYEAIAKPGSLIRIKSPRLMGKTSLMTRILARAQAQNQRTIYLDLSTVERSIISDLDKFLRWFCVMVGRQLQLKNQLQEYWDIEILGSNDNCTVYFEEYLLAQFETPLVLGIDNVDRLFPYVEVVEDCLGMLRSWHEKGKISPRWKQLRLVLAHSTECYIPLDMNQSPFNAGVPVELQEFDAQQVYELAHLQGLNWNESEVQDFMQMVGGHPYLVGLGLYEVGIGKMSLDQFLQKASTEEGIYSHHLRRHLEVLQQFLDLTQAYKKVVESSGPLALDPMQIYKLHSMGLVQQSDNCVMPRCNMYREYFSRVLSG
jgi:AAA-like domain